MYLLIRYNDYWFETNQVLFRSLIHKKYCQTKNKLTFIGNNELFVRIDRADYSKVLYLDVHMFWEGTIFFLYYLKE